MSSYRGKFVWYELMTPDLGAAETFYGSVLGWTVKDAGMPGMVYRLAETGGAQVAGLMKPPEGAPPSWVGYVAVDDVDASAVAAKRDGGVVYRDPADIPGVGRFAIIGDPDGAMLALFKGAEGDAPPAVAPGTPGHGGWSELYAGDLDRALRFYTKLFGWRKSANHDMGAMGSYVIFAVGDVPTGGMVARPPQVPMPSWLYYFNVAAIDAAAMRVRDGRGRVLNGPMEVPGGSWIVQCLDPQGVAFALVAPKR